MQDLIILLGRRLTVKLSYLNGSLKGTETYYGLLDDEEYWIKNYDVTPKFVHVEGDLAVKSPSGWFLLWQNDAIDATEMVGANAAYMPEVRYKHKDLLNK